MFKNLFDTIQNIIISCINFCGGRLNMFHCLDETNRFILELSPHSLLRQLLAGACHSLSAKLL